MCVLRRVLTWYPTPGDLHVELNGVHAQDGVPHVAEQVPGRHDSSKGRQFAELLELLLPPGGDEIKRCLLVEIK